MFNHGSVEGLDWLTRVFDEASAFSNPTAHSDSVPSGPHPLTIGALPEDAIALVVNDIIDQLSMFTSHDVNVSAVIDGKPPR
jgi:hypothetical protein